MHHPDYPRPPQVEGLSEEDREMALLEYRRQCKRFTDRLRRRRLGTLDDNVNPDIVFTGVTDPRFRTMAEVSGARLREGDTFPNKVLLSMRIVEEAIQVNATKVRANRSDHTQYQVSGVNFSITATHNFNEGWRVNRIQINVAGAGQSESAEETVVQGEDGDPPAEERRRNLASTPLRTEWIVPLMVDQIRDRPNLTNEQMRAYLLPYAPEQYFTENLLQNTRTKAKLEEFGEPAVNVQYAYHLQAAMDSAGHPCQMIFVNRGVVMSSISQILADNENRIRYKSGLDRMNSQERVAFLSGWFEENITSINKQMGLGAGHKYLLGILFTTSVGLTSVQHLQKVIQANACHVSFGKYTIYSA